MAINPNAPRFAWDDRVSRYRILRGAGRGRFVSGPLVRRPAVRGALDDALSALSARFGAYAGEVAAGKRSLRSMTLQMASEMRQTHAYAGMVATGGREKLDLRGRRTIEERLKIELGRLDDFARDVESGRQALDGNFRRRAAMYGQAPRTTYVEVDRQVWQGNEYDLEYNVLGPTAQHCDGCLAQTARGQVPIGDLVPVGERDCLSNDKCHMEFARSSDGQVTDEHSQPAA